MPLPASKQKILILNAVVAVLYISLGIFTSTVSSELRNVVFAPAGVWFSFGVVYGFRATALGILIGQLALAPWFNHSYFASLIIASFNIFTCGVGAHLYQRWRLSYSFSQVRDVLLFGVMVLLLLQPFNSAGILLTFYVLGYTSLDALFISWVNWWLSNSIGQLLFAPLFIVWLTPQRPHKTAMSLVETMSGLLSFSLIVIIAFSSIPLAQFLVLAITYPLLVWSGIRKGMRYSTLANVFIVFIILSIGASDHGFMSSLTAENRFYYVSFFIASATLFSLLLFSMFEERRDLIQQLTKQANTDFLTKLGNRAYFMQQGEQAIALAKRHNLPLSLAIIDIDKFKLVNDTYGHPAGDKVIKSIAKRCKDTLRTEDISCRIGGEEFAFIFANTTKDGAYKVMERLRIDVQNHPVPINENQSLSITFSAGIAQLHDHNALVDLLQSADKMLYKAKSSGRNQIHIA